MGIINITPDSFYARSRTPYLKEALDRALQMVDEGADIIDVGGESTRPGARELSCEKECERVIPFIRSFCRLSSVPVSIDTRKAEVASRALDVGAVMVNDVSGLRHDTEMAPLLAQRGSRVVIMHMKGEPQTMQDAPIYSDVIAEVTEQLGECIRFAEESGISAEKIIIDPGIGFGKRVRDNLDILRALSAFKEMGYPVLVGLSRKSFIEALLSEGKKRSIPPSERLAASLGLVSWCFFSSIDYVRVHDVRETADVLHVLSTLTQGLIRGVD